MKKLILLCLLLAAITLFTVACSRENTQGALKDTSNSFENPQLVGTLPDGRNVKVVIREMGTLMHNHYIYFVDNVTTVNETVKTGKNTYHTVRAFIPAENDSK